jgi:hypothetical protein
MNKPFGLMCVGFRNSLFSRPDSRSAYFPVLVITVQVFVFIRSFAPRLTSVDC